MLLTSFNKLPKFFHPSVFRKISGSPPEKKTCTLGSCGYFTAPPDLYKNETCTKLTTQDLKQKKNFKNFYSNL